jgi:hypothetical protein
MSMKIPALVSPVVLVGMLAFTHSAHAKTISIKGNSPTQVQGRCGNAEGGAYFPPGRYGVYACLNADGSGIVCGGTGKYSKTCDTWGPDTVSAPKKPSQEDFDKHAAARQQQQ